MVGIPAALVGGVAGAGAGGPAAVSGQPGGFVTLTGIATRNGILKISHYLESAAEGRRPSATPWCCAAPLATPVLMTALTRRVGAGTALLLLPPGASGEILHRWRW